MDSEYIALRIISTIFKVLGITNLLSTIALVILGVSNSDSFPFQGINKSWFVLGVTLVGVLISIPFFAISEMIKLFIRIEINTRETKNNLINLINNSSVQSNPNISVSESSQIRNTNFDEWLKLNPGKTLSDFYNAIRKK